MFSENLLPGQERAWWALQKALDEAPNPPACENFPDLFFQEYGVGSVVEHKRLVQSMCGPCPVRDQCAEYGLNYETHGYWGGLSPRDRQTLRAARNRARGRAMDLPAVRSEGLREAS